MKKLLLSLLLSLILPFFANAAGIQVFPASLSLDVAAKGKATTSITVINPTSDVSVFEVYADDFAQNISANPSSFTLESGAKKTVFITVNLKNNPHADQSKFSTDISVVSAPLAQSKVTVGTGVKIPLTVSVGKAQKKISKQQMSWLIAAMTAFILLYLFNRKLRSK